MNYSSVEHKLRVFISSRCGGKYSIARKALKTLLLLTGLVDVYAFETEPACSEDTISSYLEYVDESNLCVFLIDNEDGASPAVLSEEKRAKDQNLRLIYLFCDENKKEATPMQEEIKASMSQKYYVVNQFSDIVTKAYESIMQDIIFVYKRKKDLIPEDNNSEDLQYNNNATTNTETYNLSSICYSQYPKVYSVVDSGSFFKDSSGEESSVIEDLLSEKLQAVLYNHPQDNTITDKLLDEVLKENPSDIHELLRLRFQAQKEFYSSNYVGCMSTLQNAIKLAADKPSVPIWMANDIAIDIRHVQKYIDENSNKITLVNPGQKFLDESKQPVYFPFLDRQVEKMQEEIADEYNSQINISPYTTKSGSLEKIFMPLTNAFCIAEIHGSIVQTEITRNRLVSVYSMLCSLYNNHNFVVEYVRLLVTNGYTKGLDTLVRKYSQSIDKLNEIDIGSIISSIENIPDPNHRIMAKYLLASSLGYFMSEEKYIRLYEELVEHSHKWASDDNRLYCFESYILKFYLENTQRAKLNDIICFVIEAYKKGIKRIYVECFNILKNLDYSCCEEPDQIKVLNLLLDIVDKEDVSYLGNSFFATVVRFCKTTTTSYVDLESALEKKYSSFYSKTYLLEMSSKKNIDLKPFIESYLEEAHSKNLTQGQNGSYTCYANESLDVVYNIIKHDAIALPNDLLEKIISTSIETLASLTQIVKTKMSAVKLLQLLYFKTFETSAVWESTKEELMKNSEIYSTGYELGSLSKETNQVLSFQYNLFISLLLQSRTELSIEKLYSSDTGDSYTLLQILKVINVFLSDSKGLPVQDALLSTFLSFGAIMSQFRERDIKYYATLCIVELTNFESVKRIALMHLSQIMDKGTQSEKIAILSRVSEINAEDDAYINQILNKGKSDNNFLVRYVASRKSEDLPK